MTQLIGSRPLPGTMPDPLYPDSDGKPMGETDFHVEAIILLREGLQDAFAAREDVYVASNMFFYFDKGNPRGRRDPDVLVARVHKHLRRAYRLWEEGVVPCTLFEISSESTWREDLIEKRALYARLGVREYFLFDPDALYLDPPLQGFRLESGVSVPIAPNADGSLTSQELDLHLVAEGAMLRLRVTQTGQPILTRAEQLEEARARTVEQGRRVEEERRRVEEERRRADALAAEVERLRALLQRRDDSSPGPPA